MRKCILITTILFVNSLISCSNFKLSKDDLKWQPYKVGDILIFKSNKDEIDSIKIVDVSTYSNPKDPLSPFSGNRETLFVSGELLNPSVEFSNTDHINFLKINSGEKTSIYFNLMKMSDSLDYAQAEYSITELNHFYKIKDEKKGECFKDVISLVPNSTYKLDYDLKTYFWSKKYGYVRYDFKNGYYRELRKFLRNGKNILPECNK